MPNGRHGKRPDAGPKRPSFKWNRRSADTSDVSATSAEQIESERRALLAKLRELATAEKIYAKNPAMIGVIRGRAKAIEDRLYYLDRQAPPRR